LFLFLKYIQPTWYYNLSGKVSIPVLADISFLENESSEILSPAEEYSSLRAKHMDLCYQALQKGYIPHSCDQRILLQDALITNLYDNYFFVSRYFGLLKSSYILFIRLILFNSPIKEVLAFWKVRGVKKINIYDKVYLHQSYLSYDSSLLNSAPFVSVVIPTLNRYSYLKDVLSDLENQTYKNFEVLICDQSEPINEKYYIGWNLSITLIPQYEKALWLARNNCIAAAKGDYILLFDDDSRVESDWIEQHLRCLNYFNADISAGVTDTLVGHGLSPKESYFHLSDVFDTGNAMVKRIVFENVGLFDRQFEKQRMGDGEFGLRALLGGFPSISNPYAKRIHLKVETGGLRQMGSWDALRPNKLFAPRPIPSVLYFIRKYFGNSNAFFYIIQNVLFSFIPYRFKKSKILKSFYLVILPLILPIIIITSYKSLKESSEKLKKGAIIPTLN
jgi:glycosyltransferase involved in cell wall biosynthesis